LHTTGQLNGFSIRKMIQNRVMIFWLKKYSTNLLAVSVGAQEAFLRQAPIFENDLRLQLLYDAVNPEHFENLETFSVTDLNLSTAKPANPLIVHVGRTDPVKNHSRLFEIFHLISLEKPSAQLFLVGKTDHSRKKELTEKIKNLGLEDKVHFLGTRSDVLKILAGAKLMIFPSLWEGLPGAVLEAACLGIPVLSSALPGSRELAKYFPQIEILSLDQTNNVWKEQALKILNAGKQDQTRSLQILKESPFNIDLCLKILKNIWSQSIQ
ncbi:MAG: glycosyltransferase, partial [Pseudobdellovibrionaceae bacterium]